MAESNRDWTGVDEAMARQILHQGEKFLESQLSAAIAADQRAMTSGSIFIGFATALLGATLAHWAAEHDAPMLFGGLIAALMMYSASLCCFWAARPVEFYYPGGDPHQWWDVASEPISEVLMGESENYQERINSNARIMAANNRWLGFGSRFAATSPILAVIVWSLFLWLQAGTAQA